MPKVSVIIPTFNSERYLKECLNSIINQTLQDIEIIIVDSISKDNTIAIIEEYMQFDSRIKLLKRGKEWVSASRNAGIEIATGEYIMFLDSDDWYELNACEIAYNEMKDTNFDIGIYGYRELVDENNINNSWRLNLMHKCFRENTPIELMKFQTFIWDKIYKTSFLKEHHILMPAEVKQAEDQVFNFICMFHNAKYKFFPTPLMVYRKLREGASTTDIKGILYDLEALKACYNMPIFQEQSLETQLKIINQFLSYTFWNAQKWNLPQIKKEIKKNVITFLEYVENKYKENVLQTIDVYNKLKNFKMTPKVSVIIPTFNSELYIRETLESIICQTLEDIEIIVVDSASSDKTIPIVEEYAQKDNRINLLKRGKEFVGISRNAALDVATGDYIMFCDSDDWLEPTACEEAYNQIFLNNNDMAFFTAYEYIESKRQKKVATAKLAKLKNYFHGKSFNLYNISTPFISGSEAWYKIYKKSFLDKYNIRFGTEKFGEDTPFCIKSIVNAETVSVLNKPLYNYRKTDTSSCTSSATKFWRDIFTSRPQSYEYILQSEHCQEFLAICLPFFINSIIYWYKRWSKVKGFPRSEYFNEMHQFFKLLRKRHSATILAKKEFINDYVLYKHASKETWIQYRISKILSFIFQAGNVKDHKVITILGIRFKFKRPNKMQKNYKKYCKLYEQNKKRIKAKVAKGEKIRVAFYVNDTRWKSQNLFNLLQQHPNYEPIILVGRHSTGPLQFEYQTEEELNAIVNYYKSLNMKVYLTYDYKNNYHISLDKFSADIIFYSRPWGIAPEHSIKATASLALSCYIPYFISNSPAWFEANHEFHNILWKYFVINNDLKNEYSKVMINKGLNLSVVGYPELDTYLEPTVEDNKKYVIYAPHWSLGNTPLKYATFDWNGQYILDYAKAHPEIKWIFKPHPVLKGRLIELGLMTQEEADNYYAEWDKIGIKYEGPDYLDLFKESKALITDCGSFLAEYMPTKNPVILLRSKKATPYNFLAQKVTKYYYSVWNLQELETALKNVLIKGLDPWKERRLAMLNKLDLVTNASQNILDEFNREFNIKE